MGHLLVLTLLLSILLGLTSCQHADNEDNALLSGTWKLTSLEFSDGTRSYYPKENMNNIRIYDDSCMYECMTIDAPNGTLISPGRAESYTIAQTDKNRFIYLQNQEKHPFERINDSTIEIQESGIKYRWTRTDYISPEYTNAIVSIVKTDMEHPGESNHRYVFSHVEQNLKAYNHTLIYVLMVCLFCLLIILNYMYHLRKNKKRVEAELRLLEQEQKAIPEPMRKAITSVVNDFHSSSFYVSLRQKLNHGTRLTPSDWQQIEEQLQRVYPRFISTLISLYNMSEVELHVCYLLKLNAAPKEIASVLCKDISSISSIRSRLYAKVFSKKGSSKDWDEFIQSL